MQFFAEATDKVPTAERFFDISKKAAELVLSHELPAEVYDRLEVSVLYMDDAAIHSVNREERGVDSATDVLSFPQYENKEEILAEQTPVILLGDILISLEHLLMQAKEYGHSEMREAGFLTVHALLHLLGYDHIEEEDRIPMRQKEEEYLALLDLKRE